MACFFKIITVSNNSRLSQADGQSKNERRGSVIFTPGGNFYYFQILNHFFYLKRVIQINRPSGIDIVK